MSHQIQSRKRALPGACQRGFTLIEILVVVAIIALLVAVLLPSLKRARDAAKATVCGHHIQTLTKSGTMWLMEIKGKETAPANRGWAPFVLKMMSGETKPFGCPSNKEPYPIPAVYVSQYKPPIDHWYPSVSLDSAYFRRHPKDDSGQYQADMETDVTRAQNDQSTDFDDAYLYWTMESDNANKGLVWADKSSTGRELYLHHYKGRHLAKNFSSTEKFEVPILPSGYAMNLSAGLPGTKPWHLVYLDYKDWAAVLEPALGVKDLDGNFRFDDPDEMAALRHNGRVNAGFMDGHVERLVPSKLDRPNDPYAASIWHPERRPGWQPQF
jgi:prepilin-type N-terminal cleavage/methylation domain-containing protein/prepilin-type processing-associated H-X9-DG protein